MSPRRGQWLPLVAGWLIVGIPALWGVARVIRNSLALFGRG